MIGVSGLKFRDYKFFVLVPVLGLQGSRFRFSALGLSVSDLRG